MNNTEKDQQFRDRMAASTSENAKQWTSLDRKAESEQRDVDKMQRSLDKRLDPDRITQLEEQVQSLGLQRHEMEVAGRPGLFLRKQRAEYDEKLQGIETGLKEARQDIREWSRQSEPEVVAKHQERMQGKQNELNETVKERQGLGMLPSEEKKQEQRVDGAVETPMMRVDEWRKNRQKAEQEQGGGAQADVPQYGHGKFGFATFAATAKAEQEKMRKYENEFDWQKQDREHQPNVFRQ
ncbi:hypothetical protein [Stenotrophomonas maltophilia]|uniref:hypothetical protein n=1 Tax=Stenotrophomonas maltophilia TaxID=40324 RepID=UPI00209B6EBB|nr:hypothetical protein [Stenotrophomonas maltophilia]MCO7473063.1 hypothetical protein [Stenotrophomonas maltophilia]